MNEGQSSAGGLRISAWAIRNPIPVAVLFLALLLAGAIAYSGLPIKKFPNMDFPLVTVTVTENGAAPAQMETQITRPVEDALANLSSVRDISSNITQGVSTTTVSLAMGEDLQKKTDEVRSAIDRVRATLPRDIDEPLIARVDIDSTPILTYAVSAPAMSDAQLSWFIDDTIARALRAGDGVAQVARVGGVNREIDVLLDLDRLAAYGITAADVNDAITGMQTDAPGGRVEIGGREQTLRVQGAVDTLLRLRELTVPTSNGRFVKLTDIADVGDGTSEVRGFARLNGRPVVGFQVSKTREVSDVAVDDFVKAAVAQLQSAHRGVRFTRIFSSVDDTRSNFRSTQLVLLEGMLLAAIVVFFFLRDWRATLITALAMPISLIPTFAVIQAFGFSLNMVTLLALTLVIGILVDDAIVEIENIEKRVEAGLRPYEAALQGADSIGLAVVATTMAIVAVFMPVSFMSGPTGVFFREFGLTVSIAVLFSLLVARLLTPLLAAYFLKPAARPRERKPFAGRYRRALEWTLDHRVAACAVAGLVFLASLMLAVLLPKGFQSAGDPDFLYVNVQGPPGATAADMERTVQEVTAVFVRQPEVTGVFAQVGSTATAGFIGVGGAADLRQGTVTVLLDSKRTTSGAELRARLHDDLRAIPDARLNFLDFQGTAGFRQTLTGDDPETLQAAATQLEREMRSLPMLVNPQPVAPPTAPEVVVRPRAEEAARRGVSTLALARILRVATAGEIDANVAKLEEGERRIPIRVRLPAKDRANLERLRNLRIPTAGDATTTLGSIADLEFQAGPGQIERFNRRRQMTVEAEIKGVELGQIVAAVNALPIMRNLPAGVRPSAVGEAKNMEELFGSFALAVFAGIAMIFGVLILLFRSFFKPVVILSVVPLAVAGGFFGLLICGLALQLASLIGLLMLLGLATKNSILVVDYAVELERAGATQREALLEACRERARPIVMTTVAMAAGMLPSALAVGSGDGFSQALAVTVIGGLITSTLLSLLLVPAVYEFVDDFEQWLRPKLGRFVTPPIIARPIVDKFAVASDPASDIRLVE
jgi:HAE1 family hydrophobic/amphiphilic exporter-1